MSREPPSTEQRAAPGPGSRDLSETRFDAFELARREGSIGGVVPVGALVRVTDQMAGNSGTLAVQLNGYRDERQRPGLRLQVTGGLLLVCQRCLQPVAHGVDIDVGLRLVTPGAPADDEELEEDVVEAGETPLSLLELVEEEVILGLPFAPAHAVCELPDGSKSQGRQSPFAALKVLKQQH